MTNVALNVIEASRHLRITPELLYSYVKKGAKGGENRRLPAGSNAGDLFFDRSELDEYDLWLKEPWPSPTGARAAVPKHVVDYLKVESGGMCPLCQKGSPFDNAHIIDWSTSRSNHHHNLIRICKNCHGKIDTGLIDRAVLKTLKEDAIERVQRRLNTGRLVARWPIDAAPPLCVELLGRDEELDLAVNCIRLGESLLIHGIGGIGKTQLLLHALRHSASNRPVVWVNVDTMQGSLTARESLTSQARTMGIEIEDGWPRFDQVRACIVFDGIEKLGVDTDEISDLLDELLSRSRDALIIVTSQVTLPSLRFEHVLPIGQLDNDVAVKVMKIEECPSRQADALLTFADGHPLTLQILAALLQHFESPNPVLEELNRLGAEAVALPRRRLQLETTSLVHCLQLAYSTLGPREKRLLWLIAASPAGVRPAIHKLDRLVGVDYRQAAAELRAWSLIDLGEDELFRNSSLSSAVYTMLSPVRAFVHHASRQSEADINLDLKKAFCTSQWVVTMYAQDLQRRDDDGSIVIGRLFMDRELPNAIAAFDLASTLADQGEEFVDAAIGLANSLMMTLFMTGLFALGQRVMAGASKVAIDNGKLSDAIQFLLQAQSLAERDFNFKAAAAALEQAELLAKDAEGEPLALLRVMQASDAEIKHDHETTILRAKEAYDILSSLDGPKGNWVRDAGFRLARGLEFSGRSAEALPYYQECLEQTFEEGDPLNRGSVLHHIGNCHAFGERWQDAMHAYRQAAEHFAELGVVEFTSNALGEAGHILPHLDPLVGLPNREAIEAGLEDIINQISELFSNEEFGGRNPRVVFRKSGGIIALALHTGHRDLLGEAASTLHTRLIAPLWEVSSELPDPLSALVWNVQWMVRLMQFFEFAFEREEEFTRDGVFVVSVVASCAFVPDATLAAAWIASYLKRRCNMQEIGPGDVLEFMNLRPDDAAFQEALKAAQRNGIDPGWLR